MWNWLLYPVRMTMYRGLRKLMRAMGVLR